MKGTLHRLSAFSTDPEGGNPAGVWLGDALPDDKTMLAIAADVGYSETAFISPQSGQERTIRYFSPEAEVPFCGHATIASGVVLGNAGGEGTYYLNTRAGQVPVTVTTSKGIKQASLTCVEPQFEPVDENLLQSVLSALNWKSEELDNSIPPARAYAGAWHLVLAAKSKRRLDHLDYHFKQLKSIMLGHDLTTLQLIWCENDQLIHARNPFPVGGVVEDPATGAAAAALGGYLRDASLIHTPHRLTIHQGEIMGRPSRIIVDIPQQGGITVSGTAVKID